ncbi:unnamed protein product [Heterosigma akashiwo]|mmetsp:Transcript_12907/g.17974  ORF Transcript_12907/g.17974 Transcript_12907/m.17974 type:complete len:152 (-) Transcript_12907:581-1036(-)
MKFQLCLLALLVAACSAFVVQSSKRSFSPIFDVAESADDATAPVSKSNLQYYPDDQIPGKITLSAEEEAEQEKALKEIALVLKEESIQKKILESQLFGFTEVAETVNGRMAMSGFVIGLTVEWWTGNSIPQQLVNIGQVLGLVPLGDTDYF